MLFWQVYIEWSDDKKYIIVPIFSIWIVITVWSNTFKRSKKSIGNGLKLAVKRLAKINLTVINSLNFEKSTKSAAVINRFVENKIHGNIKNLIKASMLDASTHLVLVNTVYFEGKWLHKFDRKLTQSHDFYVNGTETVPVDFMKNLDQSDVPIC